MRPEKQQQRNAGHLPLFNISTKSFFSAAIPSLFFPHGIFVPPTDEYHNSCKICYLLTVSTLTASGEAGIVANRRGRAMIHIQRPQR